MKTQESPLDSIYISTNDEADNYRVSITHPLVSIMFSRFKKEHPFPSDQERKYFEDQVIEWWESTTIKCIRNERNSELLLTIVKEKISEIPYEKVIRIRP